MMFAASTDILLDMVAKMQNPKIAIVHQMPFITDQTGLAAAVEKVNIKLTAPIFLFSVGVLTFCDEIVWLYLFEHFTCHDNIICCFSDLSKTNFNGSRVIKINGKTGKKLHENANVLDKK